MLSAPKEALQWYAEKTRKARLAWLSSLSPEESLALYEGFYALYLSAHPDAEERARLRQERWQEKLTLRKKMLKVFREADKRKHE